MAHVKITCETDLELTFDENSKEFQDALESYRKMIDPNGDKSDMLKHVAHNLLRFGSDTIVEGVGYVKLQRASKIQEPFSGITVKDDEPDFDFEIN